MRHSDGLRAALAGTQVDINFKQTVLLLHGDGTNGGQNNTFVDSSTNNFSSTRINTPTQGSFSPFSPTGWSGHFDGSGDYLTVPNNAALQFGSSDFTVEFWIFPVVTPINGNGLFGKRATTSVISGLVLFHASAVPTLYVSFDGTTWGVQAIASSGYAVGEWSHVAVVRNGTSFNLYINGTSVASATNSGTVSDDGSAFSIAAGSANGNNVAPASYMADFRVVKGTAVYKSNFNPPTSRLTAITNTSLLTLQDNRFSDNSTNSFAISRFGDSSIQPFSAFPPASAYNVNTHGGSFYSNDSSDALSIVGTAAAFDSTGDFTVECWVYCDNPVGGYIGIISFRTFTTPQTGMGINLEPGAIPNFVIATNAYLHSTALPLRQWVHLAMVRSGAAANNVGCYINGVLVGSFTSTANCNNSINTCVINRYWANNASNYGLKGYITDVRYVVGTALYSGSSFTLPSAPLTAVTNTKLLLSCKNASIINSAPRNALKTIGNAQINTTIKKYGTGSIAFDGTGDYLIVPDSIGLVRFGVSKFTVEFWVYLAAADVGLARGLVGKGGGGVGWLVSLNATQNVVFTYVSSTITSTGAIGTDQWVHIAVVREGTGANQTKIYINGTNDGTGTVATSFTDANIMYIGANRSATDQFKGYIDDLRITLGIARYTANFAPPTAAFADQ